MARIRSLKPEIWTSSQFVRLSHSARLLFIGLVTQADDDGRGLADPMRLKSVIFPADACTVLDVEQWLEEVVRQGLALVYPSDRFGSLYCLPSWRDHQRINRPTPSRYPAPSPDDARRTSTDVHTQLTEHSRSTPSG